ncbi:MAG: hypothetical protein QXW37_01105 [Candidatus Nitrosotenuis sp.]
MMQVNLNPEQIKKVHGEIYGFIKDDSPICIQLEKLDRYIQQHNGKVVKPDTFDTFEF